MESYVICHHCKKLRKEADAPLASYTDPLLGHGIHNICRWCTEADPTPSSAGAVPASSLPKYAPPPIMSAGEWTYWKGKIRELSDKVPVLEAGQPSPPSGPPTTAEGPPGVTISITTEAGLVADCTWTPTGITCTTHGTLPLPQPDQIPPGLVEFA